MEKHQNYKIEQFNPHTASDLLWDKYFLLIEEEFREEFPTYPIPNRGVEKKELKSKNPYRLYRRWMYWSNDNGLVGHAHVGYFTKEAPEYETNKHVAGVNIMIKTQYRRQGIGTILLKKIIEDAKTMNITSLDFWGSHADGKTVCLKWGAKLLHKHYVNRLFLKNVDWDLMQQWKDRISDRAADVTFEFINEIPEKDIKQFVDLYTETINQAPWGSDTEDRVTVESRRYQERVYKEKGYTWITLCSREPNGEISGMTEILYKPEEPDFMQQDLTGVRESYRQRGIGKRLKAQMLFYIRENYPDVEYMTTGNALANKEMLSINRGMGYEETNIFHLYKYEL
ncbi:MAG: GNAT family N-acetyltransferase [Candidatus Heimdallarchaeota archaeon]|nr:GNAT family N-acetyltransferase [Candidatus Heimdallarchaeota archaeon]